MSKLFYLHVVTGLAAASVTFLPQRSLTSAAVAGLAASTGSVITRNLALKRSQQTLDNPVLGTYSETLNRLSEGLKQQQQRSFKCDQELQVAVADREKLTNQLRENQKQLSANKAVLQALRAEQQHLTQLFEDCKAQLLEKDRDLQILFDQRSQLTGLLEEHQRRIEEHEQSIQNSLVEKQRLSQLLEEAQHTLQDKDQERHKLEEDIRIEREERDKLLRTLSSKEIDIENLERMINEDKTERSSEFSHEVRSLQLIVQGKDVEILVLQETIQSLTCQIAELRKKAYSSGVKFIEKGQHSLILNHTEVDLYPEEIKSLILCAIREKKNNVNPEGRSFCILSDLLEHNDAESGDDYRSTLKFKIKELFQGYIKASGRLFSELEGLGFEKIAENEHYKFRFHNDNRYVIVFGKTVSDNRAGYNIAHEIINKVL